MPPEITQVTKFVTPKGNEFDSPEEAIAHLIREDLEELLSDNTAQGELCHDDFIDALLARYTLTEK